ncbi:MAG: L-2-hydroxyglutarate oxidase [Cyanobacteria bacterium P01_A01_bin.17]
MYDFAIIGGGIVGLATAMALSQRYPRARLILLEKEAQWAAHQTGNNSGVIHSGIYYKPGSLKAQLCREGNRALINFCRQYGIEHDICGKVIVATEEKERPQLQRLYERGLANGLVVTKMGAAAIQDIEPHVRCLEGIYVKSTGIVNYQQVARQYASLLQAQGADLRLNTKVTGLKPTETGQVIQTDQGVVEAGFLINCAGLQSDRIAQANGVDPQAKIVPFRGEYYELTPEKRNLVNGLIYPVPNPNFPFLGVHFTRMIDGSVHAGPNAVLSLKREGYRKTDFNWRDFAEVITYPGFWKLSVRHAQAGLQEMVRSWSKTAFVRSLQRLIPEVQSADLVPVHAGVRAQALMPSGKLVDDFLLVNGERSLHVCNAPSPAATSSLEIATLIVNKVPEPQQYQFSLNR